jgi:DNA polymerase III alpha subunit
MAVVEFDDLTGTIELVAFPDCYEQHAQLWETDRIIEAVAKVDRRSDQLQLICETASDEIRRAPSTKPRRAVHLCLPATADVDRDIRVMQEVFEVLCHFEGDDDVVFNLQTSTGEVRLRSRSRRVEWSERLRDALHGMLGPERVELKEAVLGTRAPIGPDDRLIPVASATGISAFLDLEASVRFAARASS